MLNKLYIIIILSILVCFPAFSYSDNTLNNLEYAKYGKVYSQEDLSSRLRRLETDSFGMSQSGSLEDRMANLVKMSSQDYYYNNFTPYQPVYSSEKKGVVRKFLDNVSSAFSSPYITGYTPSIYGSNIYSGNIYGNGYNGYRNNINMPYNNAYYFNSSNRNPYRCGNSYHRKIHHNPAYRNRYNAYYNPYGNVPTDVYKNVATRSTVHILRD